MPRGHAAKKMRTQNRAMANGRGTRGNSQAQAYMKNGYKTKRIRRHQNQENEKHIILVVEGQEYMIAYASNICKIVSPFRINFVVMVMCCTISYIKK